MKLPRMAVMLMVRSTILLMAVKSYRDPVRAVRALKMLIRKRSALSGNSGLPSYFYGNGRYFLGPNVPGWPSSSFNRFIQNELNNSLPFKKDHSRLTTIIFSITQKCPLRCLHCFEWDRLDKSETLKLSDIKNILHRFQVYGVSQVQLGGGEPMSRFDDMIDLLESADSATDFWMLTSGYGLTLEKARLLKKSGLTGVRISLDHWDKDKHNTFRGNVNSFEWAIAAAENCRKSGLAMGLSLCVTKEFLTNDNLSEYLRFAGEIHAAFILILEPRDTGHFKNMEVTLSEKEVNIIESFYFNTISSDRYKKLPMVFYPGYHQRKIGCFGAGLRYLYIDSIGSVHACPFCQEKLGNSITDDLPEIIQKLRANGCHMFTTNEYSFAK